MKLIFIQMVGKTDVCFIPTREDSFKEKAPLQTFSSGNFLL